MVLGLSKGGIGEKDELAVGYLIQGSAHLGRQCRMAEWSATHREW